MFAVLLLVSPLAKAQEMVPDRDCKQGIGLLLPLNAAPGLARAADMVRQGTQAWSNANPDSPPIVTYPTSGEPDNIIALYGQAAASGCRAIIGPLTRNAVTALASQDISRLPTLALNVPDSPVPANPSLWFFSLSLDIEARQLAWHAFQEGRRQIAIVGSRNPATTRAQQAFSDEWGKLGGHISHTYQAGNNVAQLLELKSALSQQQNDAILLAADQNNAGLIRPYLGSTPVYSLSTALSAIDSPRNVDLNGTRFLDMPWILTPDNSEVQRFARLQPSPGLEMERLYALGIDAARLATLLTNTARLPASPITGVSGTLRPQADGNIGRELLPASIQQNTVVLQDGASVSGLPIP